MHETEPQRCDGCNKRGDWYHLLSGTEYGFTFPVGVHSCLDCAESLNVHTLDDMTRDERIAAIIGNSIGYAGPKHASRIEENWRNGEEKCYCEWASACYDNDMAKLMESCRRWWLNKPLDARNRLLDMVTKWREVEEDDKAAGLSVGLSFPTMGF